MNNGENTLRRRRQTKLRAYDYSQNGAYHVIVCTKDRKPVLWRAPTVQSMIGQMKGAVTKRIGVSIWQKLQYDHVIRGEEDLAKTREYIINNALQWEGQNING